MTLAAQETASVVFSRKVKSQQNIPQSDVLDALPFRHCRTIQFDCSREIAIRLPDPRQPADRIRGDIGPVDLFAQVSEPQLQTFRMKECPTGRTTPPPIAGRVRRADRSAVHSDIAALLPPPAFEAPTVQVPRRLARAVHEDRRTAAPLQARLF